MYEELVKRLRTRNGWTLNETLDGAADAIEGLSEALSKALEALNDARNEGFDVGYWAGRRDYEPKWIPVTERLPEQNEKYLAYALEEENTMDFYDGHWMLYGTDYRRYVTHWMPLPEPPNGKA